MSDETSPPETDPDAILELAKTRLRVIGKELQRANESGGIMLRLPLDQIQTAEFRQQFNVWSLLLLVPAAGLVAIGYFVSDSTGLSILLYLGALVFTFFATLVSTCLYIVIGSASGTTSIQCSDQSDECDGFVTSLRPMIGGRQKKG